MNQSQQTNQSPPGAGRGLMTIVWILIVITLVAIGYFSWNYFANGSLNKKLTKDEIEFCENYKKVVTDRGETYSQQQCVEFLKQMGPTSEEMETSRQKAKDARIKGDMSQLRSLAENYFSENNSYIGFNTSADAIGLAQEIESIGSKVIYQNITKEFYLAYTKLITENKYFCVDSSGAANIVSTINSSATSCPANSSP